MDVLLSIVVPTYNVRDYLADCLNSIVGRYEKEIEILVIDDGSTDGSGEIADSYAEKYVNVSVFHKANGGLSDARNYGLLRAKGKYIFFLDADDMVSETHFQLVMQQLQTFGGDALLWDAELVNDRGEHLDIITESYYTHRGASPASLCSGKKLIDDQLKDHDDFVTTVWLGAYNREFLIDNQLWFEKSLIHEDELWTPKVLLYSDKVQYCPSKFYKYRIRNNSIMNGGKNDRSKNIFSLIYIFSILYAYYNWKIDDIGFRQRMQANLSKRYLHKISEYNVYYRYTEIAAGIPKWTIWKTAKGLKDKGRAFILLINGKLYCSLTKRVRE